MPASPGSSRLPLRRRCRPIVGPTRPRPDAGPPWARRTADGWVLDLRVSPGASRSQVLGEHGTALKVRVAAPANDGKANAELVRFLAETLGVPRRSVEVTHGAHSRAKTVRIPGDVDLGQLQR